MFLVPITLNIGQQSSDEFPVKKLLLVSLNKIGLSQEYSEFQKGGIREPFFFEQKGKQRKSGLSILRGKFKGKNKQKAMKKLTKAKKQRSKSVQKDDTHKQRKKKKQSVLINLNEVKFDDDQSDDEDNEKSRRVFDQNRKKGEFSYLPLSDYIAFLEDLKFIFQGQQVKLFTKINEITGTQSKIKKIF